VLVLFSEKIRKGIENIIPFIKNARNSCVEPTVFPKNNWVIKTPGTRTGFKYSMKYIPNPRVAIPKSIVPKRKPYAVLLTIIFMMKRFSLKPSACILTIPITLDPADFSQLSILQGI
jgi:hypothetical protein